MTIAENSESFDWLGPVPVEYRFYNNTVSVFYCDDEHSYVRYEDGEPIKIPGVTSATGIVDRSPALMQWSANKTSEYIQQKLTESAASPDDVLPRSVVESWLDPARFNHKDFKEKAADTGHKAHDWLENFIKALRNKDYGEVMRLTGALPEDPRAANGCMAALSWMSKHRVRWVFTERKIYSRRHDFAGTLDGLGYASACGEFGCCDTWVKTGGRWENVLLDFHDVLAIIDWKTTGSIHTNYLWQTSAYLKALEEEIGVGSDNPRLGAPVLYRFIARLSKEDAAFEHKLLLPETVDRDFQTFLNCLATYRSVSSSEREERQRKAEIKQQVREDKAAAEAARKAEREASRLRRKQAREAADTLYKKLRSEGMSVKDAEAAAYYAV